MKLRATRERTTEMRCVVCGGELSEKRVALLERTHAMYVIHADKWTVEGVATCGPKCNRERKQAREAMKRRT